MEHVAHSELKHAVQGECTHIPSVLEFDFEPLVAHCGRDCLGNFPLGR